MPRFNRNTGNNNTGDQNQTNFSFGYSGNTLRKEASIHVQGFCLREVTEDPIEGRKYGGTVRGKEAIDIVTTYNVANKAKILAKLRKEILSLKMKMDIIPAIRTIRDGQSLDDRCQQYCRGKVLGVINTCPTRFTVAGKTYLYEKVVSNISIDPDDAAKLIKDEAYLGDPKAETKVRKIEDAVDNALCISKEMMQEALDIFSEEFQPRLEGNSLYLDGKRVVDFVKEEDQIGDILSNVSNFDLTETKIKFF